MLIIQKQDKRVLNCLVEKFFMKHQTIKMPKRCNENLSEASDSPKKKNCHNPVMSSIDVKNGTVVKDISGKKWKLGKVVGVGGFGEIYLASDNVSEEIKTDCKYVAKVENHQSGPLFVEMNCYLRIAKPSMIDAWKAENNISSLGMPHYVASGSYTYKNEKYRFLILPKFDKDLEKVLQEKKMLNLKSVLTISLQIIDVLEYIHSKGYVHSDIKASNILLHSEKTVQRVKALQTEPAKHFNHPRACRQQKSARVTRNLRSVPQVTYVDDIPNFDNIIGYCDVQNSNQLRLSIRKDQIFLLDYGLACKYLTATGEHKPFCADERKAHAGTILFCSRDAHKGMQSRRSDLESLGYNLIYWLTGNLPWSNNVEDPVLVEKKKIRALLDIEYFLQACFNEYPSFLEEYFKYLQKLQFHDKPDYDYCKKLFRQGLKNNGYKDDSRLDFDNKERSKLKQLKKGTCENIKVREFAQTISRLPLQSNIPLKPLLRKKEKKAKCKRTNWFEDLTDPEEILKQAREKKNTDNQEANILLSIVGLDMRRLNPTYAMTDIYNRCVGRTDSVQSCKDDSSMEHVEGYTQAMMSVLQRAKKRKEYESEVLTVNLGCTRSGKITRRCITNRKKKSESPVKPLIHIRSTALKKPAFHGRKVKNGGLKRSYSLRG